MALESLQDQVNAILSRPLVESKVRGTPSPEVEAAAVLEMLAIALITQPRSVLYLAYLARNALLTAVTNELAQIATLTATVNDLGNQSYAITDTSALTAAQTALLNIESQQKVGTNSPNYQSYANNVSAFLSGEIAKSVKRPGATALTRPSAEAKSDLPTDYTALQTLHADLNNRLYSLVVGVANFATMPAGTILALTTSARTRGDLAGIIASLQANNSPVDARNIVQTLLAGQATLQLIGTTPDPKAVVLDSVQKLPPGFAVTGATALSPPSGQTSAGPFTLISSALAVTDRLGVHSSTFPFQSSSSTGSLVLAGATVPSSLTIPAFGNFFIGVVAPSSFTTFTLQPNGRYNTSTRGNDWILQTDGTYRKVIRIALNTTSSPLAKTLNTVKSNISSGSNSLITAVDYVKSGSLRIMLVPLAGLTRVSIETTDSETNVSAPTGPFLSYFNSVHATLGFLSTQYTTSTQATLQIVLDALNILFNTKLTATPTAAGTISVTGVDDQPGAFLSFSGTNAAPLGLTAELVPQADAFTMSGTVNGVITNPVSPAGLIDPGDTVTTPTGTAVVAGLTDTEVLLATTLAPFNGNITVTSALVAAYEAFEAQLTAFVTTWLPGKYAQGLGPLDAPIAVLSGSATPAQRATVINILNDLQTQLTALQAILSAMGTALPSGSAVSERSIINGIIQTLTERKYDKALDDFMKLKVADIFEYDYQTLSYAGSVMQAASNVVRTDMLFPNRAKDDGQTSIGNQPQDGLQQ